MWYALPSGFKSIPVPTRRLCVGTMYIPIQDFWVLGMTTLTSHPTDALLRASSVTTAWLYLPRSRVRCRYHPMRYGESGPGGPSSFFHRQTNQSQICNRVRCLLRRRIRTVKTTRSFLVESGVMVGIKRTYLTESAGEIQSRSVVHVTPASWVALGLRCKFDRASHPGRQDEGHTARHAPGYPRGFPFFASGKV